MWIGTAADAHADIKFSLVETGGYNVADKSLRADF